jgi:hypothetical protein
MTGCSSFSGIAVSGAGDTAGAESSIRATNGVVSKEMVLFLKYNYI